MKKFATFSVTALASLALVAGTWSAPASAARDVPRPALKISPGKGSYTGGSQLVLQGSLGVPGRRKVTIERHLGRPGDAWVDLPVPAGGRTNADGTFKITAPAPAMWGISYRVKGGKHRSPGQTTYPHAQEAVLSQETAAVVGQPLRFSVDTVGADYTGYRDLPAPLLPGRGFTLQRRVNGHQWTDVATGTTNSRGMATITTTPGSAGDQAYRVRLHEWRRGGDVVGWTTSFPVPVKVHTAGSRVSFKASPAVRTGDGLEAAAAGSARSEGRRHAAVVYGWNRHTRYSFDWEFGESLSSKPMRGNRIRGRWTEASDGTGRATLRNGAMVLSSSGYGNDPNGSRGSFWATQKGNASKRGRWEMRGNTVMRKKDGVPYRMRYELVPVNQVNQRCGANSITIAEVTGPGKPVKFGVRARNGRVFGGKTKLRNVPEHASFAVQVTNKHITWFIDGYRKGTVKRKVAIPKRKLVVRVSMVARPGKRMATSKSNVDWVRHYSLKKGKRPVAKKKLKRGKAWGGC